MRQYSSILFILSFLIFISCSESAIDPKSIDRGEEYYPAKSGLYYIYDVNMIDYLLNKDIVESTYQLKEEYVFSYYSDDDSTFVIYQYRRENEDVEWEPLSTHQLIKSDYNVTRYQGNTPYIKLTFPIADGNVWDGNAQNQFDEDLYQLDSVGSDFDGVLQFENTITVIQSDIEDFIVEYDRRYEIYAQDVGLVEKHEEVLRFCTDEDCIGQQDVETGMEYKQMLIEYGQL